MVVEPYHRDEDERRQEAHICGPEAQHGRPKIVYSLAGTARFNTSRVNAMASTPSLNASVLVVLGSSELFTSSSSAVVIVSSSIAGRSSSARRCLAHPICESVSFSQAPAGW